MSGSARPQGVQPAHRLAGAVAVLVGLDLVGGLVAISDGINEPGDAWGSTARLAAPWPMILLQVLLTSLAVRSRRPVATAASVLLGLACLVSAISGFFDGGLTDDRLSLRHTAFQVLLIVWTALVGTLAMDNARRGAGRPDRATSGRSRARQ